MLRILTCVDLDSLFALLCGERLESGKVKLAVGEGQLERYVNYSMSPRWI